MQQLESITTTLLESPWELLSLPLPCRLTTRSSSRTSSQEAKKHIDSSWKQQEKYALELVAFLQQYSLIHCTHPEKFFRDLLSSTATSTSSSGLSHENNVVESSISPKKWTEVAASSAIAQMCAEFQELLSDDLHEVREIVGSLDALSTATENCEKNSSSPPPPQQLSPWWQRVKDENPKLFAFGLQCAELRFVRQQNGVGLSAQKREEGGGEEKKTPRKKNDFDDVPAALRLGMNKKKRHEVPLMHQTICQLLRAAEEKRRRELAAKQDHKKKLSLSTMMTENEERNDAADQDCISTIINVGEGKGYVSRILALHEGYQVIGLDCNENHREGSIHFVDTALNRITTSGAIPSGGASSYFGNHTIAEENRTAKQQNKVSERRIKNDDDEDFSDRNEFRSSAHQKVEVNEFLYKPRGNMVSITCRVTDELHWGSTLQGHVPLIDDSNPQCHQPVAASSLDNTTTVKNEEKEEILSVSGNRNCEEKDMSSISSFATTAHPQKNSMTADSCCFSAINIKVQCVICRHIMRYNVAAMLHHLRVCHSNKKSSNKKETSKKNKEEENNSGPLLAEQREEKEVIEADINNVDDGRKMVIPKTNISTAAVTKGKQEEEKMMSSSPLADDGDNAIITGLQSQDSSISEEELKQMIVLPHSELIQRLEGKYFRRFQPPQSKKSDNSAAAEEKVGSDRNNSTASFLFARGTRLQLSHQYAVKLFPSVYRQDENGEKRGKQREGQLLETGGPAAEKRTDDFLNQASVVTTNQRKRKRVDSPLLSATNEKDTPFFPLKHTVVENREESKNDGAVIVTVLGYDEGNKLYKVLHHPTGRKMIVALHHFNLSSSFLAPSSSSESEKESCPSIADVQLVSPCPVSIHGVHVERLVNAGLIGLHPCGDLGSNILRLFLRSQSPFLLVISCCWHALTSKGFPLSSFLKAHQFSTSSLSFMLATQPIDMFGEDSSNPEESLKISNSTNKKEEQSKLAAVASAKNLAHGQSIKILFYRALLFVLFPAFCSYRSVLSPAFLRRVVKQKSTLNFSQFALMVFDEYLITTSSALCNNQEEEDGPHRLPTPLQRDEITVKAANLESEYAPKYMKPFVGFIILRLWMAPLVEGLLLMDRGLFIAEGLFEEQCQKTVSASASGAPCHLSASHVFIPKVAIFPLFDPCVSPRNFALLALR